MIYAIILAAGSSQRFSYKQVKTNKLLINLNNKLVYQYACELFVNCPDIDKVVLVLPKNKIKDFNYHHPKMIKCVGGSTRNKSFWLGLKALGKINDKDYVICHDAARIFTTSKQINTMIKLIQKKVTFGSLAYQLTDTIFINNQDKYHWIDRSKLLCIQTPQFVSYGLLRKCSKHWNGSDLLSFLNLKPQKKNLILSDMWNIKITFGNDFEKIRYFFKK